MQVIFLNWFPSFLEPVSQIALDFNGHVLANVQSYSPILIKGFAPGEACIISVVLPMHLPDFKELPVLP
jgi:hypothetical protein